MRESAGQEIAREWYSTEGCSVESAVRLAKMIDSGFLKLLETLDSPFESDRNYN